MFFGLKIATYLSKSRYTAIRRCVVGSTVGAPMLPKLRDKKSEAEMKKVLKSKKWGEFKSES